MTTNAQNNYGGFGFGQREPLARRLHNLLRDYPEGVGIVKELIQNADDAGATIVRLTVDRRQHRTTNLVAPNMASLMGPSILFYNNAKFTNDDFKNIQEISFSGKSNDLGKAGRYGIGFNSVYHVSDCPSIISGDRIVFFDPRCLYVPSTPAEPGHGWYYAQEGWWNRFPEFLAAYESGGLPHGTTDFNGTVFRLPLRTVQQAMGNEIRHEPFTADNVHRLLQSIEHDAEALLLFLKSVLTIEVYEIRDGSTEPQMRLSLTTTNKEVVANERKKLIDVVRGGYEVLTELCREAPELLPEIEYVHEISSLSHSGKCSSQWLVTGLLYVDPEGELLDTMEQLWEHGDKAVPWAGAAARISSTNEATRTEFLSGRAFCFLPLPGSTGLPIHIHGYFDLNSSRDGISTIDGRTGKSELGPMWNQLLVKHIIARACANLIEALSQEIGDSNPREYYRQWPAQDARIKGLDGLYTEILKLIYQRPVIRSTTPERWTAPSEIKTVPNGWGQIRDPLVADGWALPDPNISENVQSAFRQAGLKLAEILALEVRNYLGTLSVSGLHTHLDKAPAPSLRKRQWIVSLLEFCLSDGCRNLRGLPLALVADGTLERFGDGTHYIGGDDEREIFAPYLNRFLHPEFVQEVKGLSAVNQDYIIRMGLREVVDQLPTITKTVEEENGYWSPVQTNLPNAKWLGMLYAYLAKQQDINAVLDKLRSIPLVPGEDSRLYRGWAQETPLDDTGIQPELRKTLRKFGVVFVKAEGILRASITSFIKHHPDALIPPVSGPDLVDALTFQAKSRIAGFRSGTIWATNRFPCPR